MVFYGGSVVKNEPVNAGDVGSISGLGRSPGEGNGNLLEYSCLEEEWSLGGYSPWGHIVYHSLLTTMGVLNSDFCCHRQCLRI